MAAIGCNEINNTINELLVAFQDCKHIKSSDLVKLVELVSAVNICANGGADYNNWIEQLYQPVADQVISYPINTFHSISINVIEGSITKQVGIDTVTFPQGSSLSLTVSTLNQTVYTFTVKSGSKVYVEYLIETI